MPYHIWTVYFKTIKTIVVNSLFYDNKTFNFLFILIKDSLHNLSPFNPNEMTFLLINSLITIYLGLFMTIKIQKQTTAQWTDVFYNPRTESVVFRGNINAPNLCIVLN